MILVLCIFPYHDGRLLHDERLRHYDFWLNDFCLFVTISRCLKLLVRSLFFLSDYTPSCILEFLVLVSLHVFTRFHGLAFTAFGLFLATLVFLIYTQASCFLFF